jgi:predicted nucleotidyltransferase
MERIIQLARKYEVGSVYLFGSSLDDDRTANDIDLGVKGIGPRSYFKFYGELLRALSRPVGLVDLSKRNRFNSLVERRGVKIYG